MDVEAAEDGAPGGVHVRANHIKKRALKNKSLSVSFDEKSLKDFVSGFHKRKKKRRKEAHQQQENAERRKRIELRKKRKLERDFVQFGAAPPDSAADGAEPDEEHEDDEDDDSEPIPSVSGTTLYDNGDMQVTVTTIDIGREEEDTIVDQDGERPTTTERFEKNKPKNPVVRKKLINRAPKKRSRPKTVSKRDKRKGKKKKDKRD